MTLRVGSLCTGAGGLDLAIADMFPDSKLAWYSEFEKHPSTLLAQRFPDIPNLGDLTKIDWATVPRVDILTFGYPCQPFSIAGKKLGEDDPRHLWPHIREAIRILRPGIAFGENVSNHRRIGFSTVLRDCAEDGLDVRWTSVRASDVGAPHQRERLFFLVTNPDGEQRQEHFRSAVAATEEYPPLTSVSVLFPTPRTTDGHGGGGHGTGGLDLRTAVADPERIRCEWGSPASIEEGGPFEAAPGLRTSTGGPE